MKQGILTRGRRALSSVSRRAVRKVARGLERRLVGVLERRFRREIRPAPAQQATGSSSTPTTSRTNGAPGTETTAHADERAIRHAAEVAHHGLSSQESDARYERGDNPGGTHAATPAAEESVDANRETPNQREDVDEEQDIEEPEGRSERTPGGPSHLPSTRRGS